MCGRFSLFADDDELVSLFDIDLLEGEHAPTWNQAPSQQVRVVMDRPVPAGAGPDRQGSPSSMGVVDGAPDAPAHASAVQRTLRLLEWGLVPGWARTPSRPMINARAETLVEKPSFRAAAARRRCLVPANGYFEWQAPAAGTGPKQAWFLSAGAGTGLDEGDPVVAFAGICEAWRDPSPRAQAGVDGGWLLTCAIVTRAATDSLGRIHDRMPVVVPPDLWDAWLDPRVTDPDQVDALLRSLPDPDLVPRTVGRAVGDVRNDSPDLIVAVECGDRASGALG